MPRFLIEVPHDRDVVACANVVRVFLSSGSHFLANADWGCLDGRCSAWLVAEVESREEARRLVPPAFRADAVVVALNAFTMEDVDGLLRLHQGTSTPAAVDVERVRLQEERAALGPRPAPVPHETVDACA
ncbi:MAG: hypothetical protein AB7G23_07200 [Vicinamibacterales bacterium]